MTRQIGYQPTDAQRLAGAQRTINTLLRRQQIPVNGASPVAQMRKLPTTIPGDGHDRWLDTTGHFDTSDATVFSNDPTTFDFHDTWNTTGPPYNPHGLTVKAVGTYIYFGTCEVQSGGTTGNKLDAYQAPDGGDVSLFVSGRRAADVHDSWDADRGALAHISWVELRTAEAADLPMTVVFQNKLAGGADASVAWNLWVWQLSPYVLTDI